MAKGSKPSFDGTTSMPQSYFSLCLDYTIVTLAVYFVPKLTATEETVDRTLDCILSSRVTIKRDAAPALENAGDSRSNPRLRKLCAKCGFGESVQAIATQEIENQSNAPSCTARDSVEKFSSLEETDRNVTENREPSVGFSLAQELVQ